MSQAIRELGWRRSDIIVSTKIFWGGPGPNDKGLSRKHIVEGTKASLKRLDMEYVDVLYCHRPDASTPIEETVRAMNYVIDKGWHSTGEQVNGQLNKSQRHGELLRGWIWSVQSSNSLNTTCLLGTKFVI